MKPFDMPELHNRVLPVLRQRIAAQSEEKKLPDYYPTTETDFEGWDSVGEAAVVFDCRPLPFDFTTQSGEAAFEEFIATKRSFKTPFEYCYFEFFDANADATFGVLSNELKIENDPTAITEIELLVFMRPRGGEWFLIEDHGIASCHFHNWSPIEKSDGVLLPEDEMGPHDFFDVMNSSHVSGDIKTVLHRCAYAMCGAVTLLSEKFLSSERKLDPAPKLTKAREKRGKHRVTSDYYVLRVNVAAIRAATRPPAEGTHESPLLHWRRGHWRVLHRGSEFESKTWVKKCLVGDPAKGFAAKHYRLVKEQPLIGVSA